MDENEKSVVIDKTFTCPVCDKKIRAKEERSRSRGLHGRAKSKSSKSQFC